MTAKQTMHLGNLSAPRGARKRRKRVGLGMGSGRGKTATRGSKGQRSRSGSRLRPGFEGGQMPLYRRVPKSGFTNIFKKVYSIVNLKDLHAFQSEEKVTPETLAQRGLIRKPTDRVKILSEGGIPHPLEIHAHSFSQSAQRKIAEAGGKFVVMAP